jgi:D-lyxose ketol-isomerase
MMKRSEVDILIDGAIQTLHRHHIQLPPFVHEFRLTPGSSITLTPYLYHEFWAERGAGTSIVGEVSSVNDDDGDNSFLEKIGRFPKIEEDVPARYKLCTES